MTQAIRTKYLCPTNRRGSRIIASCQRGRIVVEYDDALSQDRNHVAACVALCNHFIDEDAKRYGTPVDHNPWGRALASGTLPDGSMCHAFHGGLT